VRTVSEMLSDMINWSRRYVVAL